MMESSRFARDPSKGDVKRGDHFLQADVSGVTLEKAELPNAENKKG
jgi:hypothetical protein